MRIIRELKTYTTDLTKAQREYVTALKTGNAENVNYWSNETNRIKASIDAHKEQASAIDMSRNNRAKLNKIIADTEAAERKQTAAAQKSIDKLHEQKTATQQTSKEMQQLVTQAERWIATMVVMRGLRNVWNGMTEYARSYYDAMNEIRIVTGYTEEQAERLGASYRALAADMSVSSQEIAKAAVEYWRQGLDESEVEQRLKYTTVYAKISAMDFQQAAELMTAATNSMGMSADRVADVWAYLGDASASGADEIGIAMQKVSAVADQAGISFEWLGSYIATLSEKTRLAPEAIGTAMNSILSRLQQIKQKGFNDEDVYKINDIAKALGSLEKPIALMDEATGEWRNFPDILNDIADQWGNLTDKEQAYIATTMGGTRQRNFLLTLLNDLSKSAEGGSRAWELYAGAQNAAGVAMEKYAIYEESVEAAQGRLNAALEEFYSILMNGNIIRGFYDMLTSIVQTVNNAADSMNGLNVKLALVSGGVVLLAGGISKIVGTAKAAAAAMTATGAAAGAAAGGVSLLNLALTATVAGVVIGGLLTLAGTFTNLEAKAKETAKAVAEFNKKLDENNSMAHKMNDESEEIKRLGSSYGNAQSDVDTFLQKREALMKQFPELKGRLTTEVNSVDDLAAGYSEMAEALDKVSESYIRANTYQAIGGLKEARNNLGNARLAYYGGSNNNTLYQLRRVNRDNTLYEGVHANSSVNLKNASIQDLQEMETLAQQYIQAMENDLDANIKVYDNKTIANIRARIAEWRTLLYNGVEKELFEKQAEANSRIKESVKTFVTAALDSVRNPDIPVQDIPNLIDAIMGLDWDDRMYTDEGVIETRIDMIVSTYLDAIANARDKINQAIDELDGEMPNILGNVNLKNRPKVSSSALDRAGWGGGDGDYATILSQTYSAGIGGRANGYDWQFDKNVVIDVTPILPDGTVLSPYELEQYLDGIINSGLDLMEADKTDNGGKGLLLRVSDVKGTLDEAYAEAEQFTEELHNLQADYYDESAQGITDAWVQSMVTSLRESLVSDAQIAEIMWPYFEQLGVAYKDMIAQLFGNSEVGAGGSGGGTTDFDAQLSEAFALLERVQTLRESITEMVESSTLSESILDALKALFTPEDWQALLDSAADEMGNLDFSLLIDALRNALAEAESEMEGNTLIAALGLGEDSEAAVQAAIDKLAEAADVDSLAKIWESLPQKTKDAMGEAGQQIEDLLASTAKDAEDSATKIEKALQRIKRAAEMKDLIDTNKVWEDLDGIIDDLTSTMDKAMGAISDINDKLNDAGTAAGALEAAMAGDQSAIEYLAGVTGLAADTLANDLSPAELLVAEMGDQAIASMEYLANMLITLNAIQVDPSGKLVAIGSIEEAANSAGMTVAALASFLASMNGAGLNFTTGPTGMHITTKVPKITWTGGKSGGTKRSSGGGGGRKSGGGGGGGSAKNAVSDLVESMLDEFDRVNSLRDHRRELAQMGQSYHEARGEIQGVIAYLQMERDIVEEDTAALEAYVAQLEAQIEANRAIVTTEAAGSKAYNQAMIDLDKLQEEHQKYSKTLIQNRTDVENLTDAIKKQYDKIRQMEIDLRNTILEAIEDREAANERMLSGRIAMEDEIMDRIKKRYEAERDQIIETQNARKSALEDEINQIDELLEQRKKLAEQEDKMQEIAELETQIARISADPTRQKEALQLRQKLAKLREDMAWDTAEAEAQAQKDSIKKQITSIEDYIQYVQDYYEDLFKHPQKLIEEMQEILTWTDDQIIAWLKKNTENYYDQTEAVQRKMVNEWQETLDDMRDTIRTHWEEVETIIAGGADNIINFLTTYSQKYREAGKLQAEAYVDEWKQQLKDLENAYKQVNANIQSYDYVKTTKVDSGSGGGGGSSGGSGGSSGSSKTVATPKKTYYRWEYANTSGGWVTSTKNVVNQSAFDGAKKRAMEYWSKYGGNMAPIILQQIAAATMTKPGKYLRPGTPLYEYKTGGMSMTTGLAWLDGTKSRPERILSSYQTELFEDMINTLHQIRSVSTGGIMSAPKLAAGSMLPNIDTINITVEQLNSDTDYDDAAERLVGAFYKKVARTRPVGGIQGW